MYRVLIIEDDEAIAESIKELLIKWKLEPYLVTDFHDVLGEFAKVNPQLVLLDIMLPFNNGFYWCSQIRLCSKIPIIFLSSASDNMNIVMAMNMGGDDFIAKPFNQEVLAAKVQALLRRSYDFAGTGNLIECNGVVLNLNEMSLVYQECKIDLTKNEFRIMKSLMENRDKIVSRETIMTKLWESDSYIDDNTLTVNINRLRKKLENYGLEELIQTKKGIGYMIKA